MKKFSTILEGLDSDVVVSFGRFNPPTTGHEKLVKKVADVAKSKRASYKIFLSHSTNAKKDPLPYNVKLKFMKEILPMYSNNIINSSTRTIIDIATELYKEGYKNLTVVVGSDRVREFSTLLKKYNNKEARHGIYNFDNIEVVSAGERDPDADGVSGMSASKMRGAAEDGDYDLFKTGVPGNFKKPRKLYDALRKHMNIRASLKIGDVLKLKEEEYKRELYLTNKIYQVGSLVEYIENGIKGEIIRRGTNYVQIVKEDKTITKAWLYELK